MVLTTVWLRQTDFKVNLVLILKYIEIFKQVFKSSFYCTENSKTHLLSFSSNMFQFVFHNKLQNLIVTTNEVATFSFHHFTKISSILISHFSYTLRFRFILQSRLNKGSFNYAKFSTFPQNIWFRIPQQILKQIK